LNHNGPSQPEQDLPRLDRTASTAPIQSVQRAVNLLRLFLPNRGTLGLSDIAGLTGWSTSTAHRYCAALRGAGLLRYDVSTGRYGLGGGCIELGLAALDNLPVVELARPVLSELVKRVDRTTVLGVWDEHAVRVVEVNDNTSAIARVTVRLGSQLDVFATAQGLVFLAFSPRIRQRFSRWPEMDAIQDAVAETAREGCALLTSVPGVRSAAAPVFHADQVVASVAIIGSTDTMPTKPESRLVDHLREAADQLTRQLSTRA